MQIANSNLQIGDKAAAATSPSRFRKGSHDAKEVHDRFTQFVGETFFGQMIKAMRTTVGKPAYFNGGRAEEVFQGQLDQQLAQHISRASASKFTEPMFQRQFPQLAAAPNRTQAPPTLDELRNLRRA